MFAPTKWKTYQLLLLDGVPSDQVSQSWVCAGGLDIREKESQWSLVPQRGAQALGYSTKSWHQCQFKKKKKAEGQGIPQSHTMQRISLKRFIGGLHLNEIGRKRMGHVEGLGLARAHRGNI